MSIMDIFGHVSPTAIAKAIGQAADGEIGEAVKTLGISYSGNKIKDHVLGHNNDADAADADNSTTIES